MSSGKIKCIFFCEFHPTAGRKVSFQVPRECISKEFFDAIQVYIIPKPELQTRLITVNTLGQKIIGCPVYIENKKYDRNALIFNCCFLFDEDTRTVRYEPVVKKLATYLTQLELESSFLSNEETKLQIPKYLGEILEKLNQSGSCCLFINESCTVNLKISPSIEDPKPVQDHDVPVFLNDKPSLMHWDLTTQQVLQYIDGYNHVAKIASEADIEINLVKACLQNLLHIDVITVVSIFQYSNMYTTTSHIRILADDPAMQEECLKNVSTKGHALPRFRDVFMLYASLTPGLTVRDLCMRFNPHSLKVDEKKLIQFGLKNKFIRRLHGYPVKLPSESKTLVGFKVESISRFLNGTHCLDEISCKSGLTYKELDEIIDNDPSIIVTWK